MASMSHEHDNGSRVSSMPGDTPGDGGVFSSFSSAPRSYALSGKIMLSAIVILFTVVLLILCLHVYARWYLLRRARRRRLGRRRLVFRAENQGNGAAAATRGLDPEVIKALPVFTYTAAAHGAESDESVECAVCLSEFQENEKGRALPRCKHRFHIECIDMWFYSHATCPLCRSTVEPEPPLPVSDPVHIQIEDPPPAELCDSCRREDEGCSVAAAASSSFSFSPSSAATSCSSSNSPGAGPVIRIEVPSRRGVEVLRSLEEEVDSPGGAQGFKSPASRMRSLKRILSIDLRFYRGGCSSSEADLESGGAGAAADAAEEQTPRTPHQQR